MFRASGLRCCMVLAGGRGVLLGHPVQDVGCRISGHVLAGWVWVCTGQRTFEDGGAGGSDMFCKPHPAMPKKLHSVYEMRQCRPKW